MSVEVVVVVEEVVVVEVVMVVVRWGKERYNVRVSRLHMVSGEDGELGPTQLVCDNTSRVEEMWKHKTRLLGMGCIVHNTGQSASCRPNVYMLPHCHCIKLTAIAASQPGALSNFVQLMKLLIFAMTLYM